MHESKLKFREKLSLAFPSLTAYSTQVQSVEPIELPGYYDADFLAAYKVWYGSARLLVDTIASLRPAVQPSQALRGVYKQWIERGSPKTQNEAKQFFDLFRILNWNDWREKAFFTGYYEPLVEGSYTRSADFQTPVLARPKDLITLPQDQGLSVNGVTYYSARLDETLKLVPYWDRKEIETNPWSFAKILLWLRDDVEFFMAQVQGSARVKIVSEEFCYRLVYAGRNGHPYTSIGRLMIDQGLISATEMSLLRLKQRLRDLGTHAKSILQNNRSYVFFDLRKDESPEAGPIGGASIPLTPHYSIAIDRSIYPYGLPFYIGATLPWESSKQSPFHRLVIGQDTGSAIIGPCRADIFMGCGEEAGQRAGDIRHNGTFSVCIPRELF